MGWISYPLIKGVYTHMGPVVLAFTNGRHVHVSTGAHVNDHEPTIAVRGIEYLISVHLYADRDWSPVPGGEDRPNITRRSLTAREATPTVRDAIVAELTRVVRAYVEAHPDVLRAAEYADANNDVDRLQRDVDELVDQLAAKHEELKAQRARMAAHAPPD